MDVHLELDAEGLGHDCLLSFCLVQQRIGWHLTSKLLREHFMVVLFGEILLARLLPTI